MLRTAIVVGAGPVGCLAALALAKRGWLVQVYEARPDLRLPASKAEAQQRSINLAISHRGIAAIEVVDPQVAQRFLRDAIPMRGRMIHASDGRVESQAYDRHGQCINSIDRSLLNEELLDEVSAYPNIEIYFRHKVLSADFDNKSMTVRDNSLNKELTVDFDFCIGADGSYSIIRRQMMRVVRMNYQQEYVKDEYIELKIPAGHDDQGRPVFLLDPNHLHIWPRHSFMLIALPNKDKTFTCTLFAPSSELGRLNNSETILAWFRTYFPDALKLIGEKRLLDDLMQNPRSPLICTKCDPYHYKDSAILLGDAAHSMVPFYGQGLNCGLEDVRVLLSLIDGEKVECVKTDRTDPKLALALQRYSESRHEDLVAICDLAMDNYVEMRHSVTQVSYLLKKYVDSVLYALTSRKLISLDHLLPVLSREAYPQDEPRGWIPLYTMVTFRPDISYAAAKRRATRQNKLLNALGWVAILGPSLLVTSLVWKIGTR
ncbi:FAD/NAD(P)-binding domain containing protein [Amanita muscaria]